MGEGREGGSQIGSNQSYAIVSERRRKTPSVVCTLAAPGLYFCQSKRYFCQDRGKNMVKTWQKGFLPAKTGKISNSQICSLTRADIIWRIKHKRNFLFLYHVKNVTHYHTSILSIYHIYFILVCNFFLLNLKFNFQLLFPV